MILNSQNNEYEEEEYYDEEEEGEEEYYDEGEEGEGSISASELTETSYKGTVATPHFD